ncbi:hypothetical protein COW36_00975 [bacterium (Candidatus Blackallbacteria) CG17_big_fil_post_rev_8_21_14_2_50_48_46]|uniref:Uncharacterized protein n=1 Tax=bacterium (Candidatus Blackallbacteria) CG17_big_fil_post_rev_8_21_14_2_50_48_46 TaxID=2014261 RepID=A0A2M7GB77_9BACT|nr:MAG: hypothetical protein COW64_10200 [bacterium (Candidatus Blackallbacteria) CG18_big_fil_WC_8_21_14_2_50_49_26]PIW19441.1 MAG: hypothetical protein COW36_00975 [bacterium (Candidatus Blackallbacteria) CG17_big_fil_post_rev_8_21_14_2_50_48_46]PIW48955.1 MAG: hypothetical protein COW20_07480 [bacterium (Candidatus Blackallbacteria) CG13_big_fil_rev_8_21_14_2_50_49_14]
MPTFYFLGAMIKNKLFFSSLFIFSLLLNGCANKVRDIANFNKRVVFQFFVQGKLALNNENVTYYILINAPSGKKDVPLNPSTNGPRVNAPSLNDGPQFLAGRLPFIGQLPGDIASEWTDFYYLQGTADGQGTMGRGRFNNATKAPEIIQRNYPINNLWSKKTDSSFEVQILVNDLTSGTDTPGNLVFNLATSDSIDTGQGYVYDYWRSNIPFSVQTKTINSQIQDQDPNGQIIMRQIPGKPLPQLPIGVNQADVNIVSYNYRIIQ